jgi:hypothetical protein
MNLPSEIKLFTKNTLIVALFFALALELSWDYVAPMLGMETNANSNAKTFQQVDVIYMGNTATALSLSLGQKDKQIQGGPVILGSDIVTIAEVLARPADGQRRLIGTHMQTIQTYVNLLETDIPSILDRADDRTAALDEHIALLKSYGTKTNDRLVILDEQISDLKAILTHDAEETAKAKSVLQSSLASLDYNGVDTAIDSYTATRNSDTHARIYLIYLERFRDTYAKLQGKNRTILTALTENRDALIKKSKIIIPTAGADILKDLGIIQSEAQYKAQKSLD